MHFLDRFRKRQTRRPPLDFDEWPAVQKKKTADRPHPITICLAFLSPLLAVVATVISLKSLKTSDIAMKVGQRAYIAIENGKVVTEDDGMAFQPGFDVINLGRTPARDVTLNYEAKCPTWCNILKGAEKGTMKLGDLGPSPGPSHEQWLYIQLTQNAMHLIPDFAVLGVRGMIVFKADIEYRDVFGDLHKDASQCWEIRKDKTFKLTPEECDPELQNVTLYYSYPTKKEDSKQNGRRQATPNAGRKSRMQIGVK